MNVLRQKSQIFRDRLDLKRSLRVYGFMVILLILFVTALFSAKLPHVEPEQPITTEEPTCTDCSETG